MRRRRVAPALAVEEARDLGADLAARAHWCGGLVQETDEHCTAGASDAATP